MAWQLEKFPGRSMADAADAYMYHWFGYAEHWEAIVAAWDEDADFAVMWPGAPSPFLALYSCIKCVHDKLSAHCLVKSDPSLAEL